MGFLSFTRKRKTSEHPSTPSGGTPTKRSFSSFSLRPRSFFDHHHNEPPARLERAPQGTRERAALLHDLNANYFSQSLPTSSGRGNRGATFHAGANGAMDWRAGAVASEQQAEERDRDRFQRNRDSFAAFMARNGLDADDSEEMEEELLPPRRQPRDGRPIGVGERHSMFDAPCAPVEPLAKVPTNTSFALELPPGAMQPTPPRIDFNAEVFRPIDWEFGKQHGNAHNRTKSCPLVSNESPRSSPHSFPHSIPHPFPRSPHLSHLSWLNVPTFSLSPLSSDIYQSVYRVGCCRVDLCLSRLPRLSELRGAIVTM